MKWSNLFTQFFYDTQLRNAYVSSQLTDIDDRFLDCLIPYLYPLFCDHVINIFKDMAKLVTVDTLAAPSFGHAELMNLSILGVIKTQNHSYQCMAVIFLEP
jgi:hypothetical protein